jgi:hypothetical protein
VLCASSVARPMLGATSVATSVASVASGNQWHGVRFELRLGDGRIGIGTDFTSAHRTLRGYKGPGEIPLH